MKAELSRQHSGPPVDVVVVNYNTREELRECLASVVANNARQIVVVDNGSSDGSAGMVQQEYPDVKLVINSWNRGYGAGANQGIANCRSRYALILNSDTRLPDRSVQALSEYLDAEKGVGLVGPRVIGRDGMTQPSGFPLLSAMSLILLETSVGKALNSVSRLYGHRGSVNMKPGEVGWVLGAALAVRRDAFDSVGGFDESFFMYAEEVDLCYRLRAIGWKIHFAPVTDVIHTGAASTKQSRATMLEQLYSSRLRFSRKHHSFSQQFPFVAAITYLMMRNILVSALEFRRAKSSAMRLKARGDIEAWNRVLAQIWRK